MQFIDSHCHLQFKDFEGRREQVLAEAESAGVSRLICVGCSLADSQAAIGLASQYQNIWATAGAHPHDGQDFLEHPDGIRELKKMWAEPKVIAIGEIGLDYFHEYTPKAKQQEVFRQQLEVGSQTDLPFIFHVRDAWSDFWEIIDEYEIKSGVIHSFTGHRQELDEAIRRGLHVALNGIVTFTKDQQLLEVAKLVPDDKLLLETDAPFLTPAPIRGKICESKHVVVTAEFLANLRGQKLEFLAQATTANAIKLFKLRD